MQLQSTQFIEPWDWHGRSDKKYAQNAAIQLTLLINLSESRIKFYSVKIIKCLIQTPLEAFFIWNSINRVSSRCDIIVAAKQNSFHRTSIKVMIIIKLNEEWRVQQAETYRFPSSFPRRFSPFQIAAQLETTSTFKKFPFTFQPHPLPSTSPERHQQPLPEVKSYWKFPSATRIWSWLSYLKAWMETFRKTGGGKVVKSINLLSKQIVFRFYWETLLLRSV